MFKFATLDQHIKWQGKFIPPYTEVEVVHEDMPIWNELVRKKVAEGPQVALELPEDDFSVSPPESEERLGTKDDESTDTSEPEKWPGARRRKSK